MNKFQGRRTWRRLPQSVRNLPFTKHFANVLSIFDLIYDPSVAPQSLFRTERLNSFQCKPDSYRHQSIREAMSHHLNLNTALRLSPNVAFRPLGNGESAVLVQTKTGQLYTCNETTAAFLQAMDGNRTIGAIVENLQDIFEVEPGILTNDMLRIAGELMENGLICPAETNAA